MDYFIKLEKPFKIEILKLIVIAYNFESIIFKYEDSNNIEFIDIVELRIEYIEHINLNDILNEMIRNDFSYKMDIYNEEDLSYISTYNLSLDNLFSRNNILTVY